MHCALFQEFVEIIFKFPADLGVRNESTVKSGIFPRRMMMSWCRIFETCFLYLAEYSVKNFITTRQYLVNLTCNCWFKMCAQFHQKLISYKCMHFLDCLVNILLTEREWRSYSFFPGSNLHCESYVRRHVCHTTVVVMWRKTLNFSSLIKPSRC